MFLDLNKHALIVYSDIGRFFRPWFLLSSWAILNTLHFVSHRAQVARPYPCGRAVRCRRRAALSRPEICIRQLIISIRRLDLFLSPLLLVQTSKVCIGVSWVIVLQFIFLGMPQIFDEHSSLTKFYINLENWLNFCGLRWFWTYLEFPWSKFKANFRSKFKFWFDRSFAFKLPRCSWFCCEKSSLFEVVLDFWFNFDFTKLKYLNLFRDLESTFISSEKIPPLNLG